MADGAQKTWLPLSLNRFAQKKTAEAIQQLGKALPCSVTAIPTPGVPIVTVKFEINAAPFTLPNVTVPMFGPEYIRYPVQVGCKGVVFPADVYLGGVSGLGDGVADLTAPANLSALVFFPIGNAKWMASEAPGSIVIYGPDGAVIRNAEATCSIVLTDGGVNITLPPGGTMNITGVGASGVFVDATGNVVVTPAAGKNVLLGGSAGTKKVVLDGDPVAGGVVHASSTKVQAL